ncbi:very short patch repair endonuclease [Moritella viscosa]|uniref:very short patch repair endonuclease n=1 Tax=Moritella viscosa TaxID=80854 RepID=UPI000920B784|nr:very short patch repair endonuclease [Moritella viscosa]SGY88136.1 Vsr [Moritella viscosa]
MPKTRTEFWSKKINDNRRRDKLAYKQLISNDWRVLYTLQGRKKFDQVRLTDTIEEWLMPEESSAEISYIGVTLISSI